MAQRISFALGNQIFNHHLSSSLDRPPITPVCVFFVLSLSILFVFSLRIYSFFSLYDVIHSFIIPSVRWQLTTYPQLCSRYHTHDGVFCSLCIFFSQRMSGGSYGLSICTSPITNDGVFLYVPLDLFCFISENPVSLLLLFINWIRPLWFPLQHVSGEANRHLSKSNIYGIYQRKMFRCLIACSVQCWMIWMSA